MMESTGTPWTPSCDLGSGIILGDHGLYNHTSPAVGVLVHNIRPYGQAFKSAHKEGMLLDYAACGLTPVGIQLYNRMQLYKIS